jgi:hypothetical protein
LEIFDGSEGDVLLAFKLASLHLLLLLKFVKFDLTCSN